MFSATNPYLHLQLKYYTNFFSKPKLRVGFAYIEGSFDTNNVGKIAHIGKGESDYCKLIHI